MTKTRTCPAFCAAWPRIAGAMVAGGISVHEVRAMRSLSTRATRVLAVLLLWSAAAAAAGAIRAGAPLPPVELGDQHGHLAAIDASVHCVLLTRDMDAGKLVKEALDSGGSELLRAASAVYISDISRMPALVT